MACTSQQACTWKARALCRDATPEGPATAPMTLPMDPRQQAFLLRLARLIPRLFEAIAAGHATARLTLGTRKVGRRRVRLSLLAECIDDDVDPLDSHGRAHATVDDSPRRSQSSPRKRQRRRRMRLRADGRADVFRARLVRIRTTRFRREHARNVRARATRAGVTCVRLITPSPGNGWPFGSHPSEYRD